MSHPSPHIPWWVKSGAAWAATHPAEALVLAYAARYAPVPTARIAWAVGAETATYLGRLGPRVGMIAFESSAIVRGAVTVGKFGGAVAAGYLIGATAGSVISYAVWGEEGARDAMDLYTGQVGVHEYVDVVSSAFRR